MKAKVLQLLRDSHHDFVSGEKISEELACSRTMVWKYIDALRKEGYEIQAISNKGYQLIDESNRISEHAIKSRMGMDDLFQHFIVKQSVESTQKVANNLINEGADSGTVVIAEEQKDGRGRLGRTWFSPAQTGVWMSLILKPELDFRQAPQLTLITAVAVARAVERVTGIELKIKWPNDLLLNDKKVCGILTEMQADPDRIKSVIIGIGLNVNQLDFPEELETIATSLAKESGISFHRVEIIMAILKEMSWLYEAYLTKGFSVIKPLWEARSNSLGKKITARTAKEVISGIGEGIDDDGVLILRDDENVIKKIYSADIEVSKN